MCYQLATGQAKLLFGLRAGAYDTHALICQLQGLAAHLDGAPAIVCWDNLNVHHSRAMRAFTDAQPWLDIEFLPAYAPELNPAEGVWANLKGGELANHCCLATGELEATAQLGSIRIRRDPELLWSFLGQTPLRL